MTMREKAVNSVKANATRSKGLQFSKEQLEELYWHQEKNLQEIGSMYGVTGGAIKYWFKKLGVKFKPQSQEPLLTPSPSLSYVSGVLHGDGFLYYNPARKAHEILMSITELVFANSFKQALVSINIRAGIVQLKPVLDRKPSVKVYATCKNFAIWWKGLSVAERLKVGMAHPWEFIRGLYESDGSIKLNKGDVNIAIYTAERETADATFAFLFSQGYNAKLYERTLESGKPFFSVCLYRKAEVHRFIERCKPCIKKTPRGYANAEPSRRGDASEGVESTKAPRPGVE